MNHTDCNQHWRNIGEDVASEQLFAFLKEDLQLWITNFFVKSIILEFNAITLLEIGGKDECADQKGHNSQGAAGYPDDSQEIGNHENEDVESPCAHVLLGCIEYISVGGIRWEVSNDQEKSAQHKHDYNHSDYGELHEPPESVIFHNLAAFGNTIEKTASETTQSEQQDYPGDERGTRDVRQAC